MWPHVFEYRLTRDIPSVEFLTAGSMWSFCIREGLDYIVSRKGFLEEDVEGLDNIFGTHIADNRVVSGTGFLSFEVKQSDLDGIWGIVSETCRAAIRYFNSSFLCKRFLDGDFNPRGSDLGLLCNEIAEFVEDIYPVEALYFVADTLSYYRLGLDFLDHVFRGTQLGMRLYLVGSYGY